MTPPWSTTCQSAGLKLPSSCGVLVRYVIMNVPTPASSRTRLVSGDDHVTCCTCAGVLLMRPNASGAVVGAEPFGQPKHLSCSSQYRLILLRLVACQVRRAVPLACIWKFSPGLSRSCSYSHFVGSPAF